jgi:hypothetical protein
MWRLWLKQNLLSYKTSPKSWRINGINAVVNSRWPAVASFRRADIMFHASAIWTISSTLPPAQLIDRKASNCRTRVWAVAT